MVATAPTGPVVLVMAAGHGTRMRSTLAKVLHPVCGRPMIGWVLEAARRAQAGRLVVVVRPGEQVAGALPADVAIAEQHEGEGTGAAVLAARAHVDRDAPVLVLSGDHPLISAEVVAELLGSHERERPAATLLTTEGLHPAGYGRVVRDSDGGVERIVETKYPERVAPEVLALREVNVGTYVFEGGPLLDALDAVGEEDGERYLTGVVAALRRDGRSVAAHRTDDTLSAFGVNTRADLMEVERRARRRLVEEHAVAGVGFAAPESVVLDVGVEIGQDTLIETGVTLRGACRIGRGCRVGPHSTLQDVSLGDDVSVLHSYLVDCEVESGAVLGPFAYLRPGASIGEQAKVGTFVEVKNSRLERGVKVPHLSYVGDSDVGEGTNLGAGNITANYDGATRTKHRTVIGPGVRTGVHTSFVAPVSVGSGAYTAAGSVITEDVPEGALAVARARQRNVEGYARRAEGARE